MSALLASHTIGVIGSGSEEHDDLASDVGRLLARLGVNLLTGGGRGVMTSVARAYIETPGRRGISIGIIPCASIEERDRPKDGYPNRFVELAIHTHLPYSGLRGQEDLSRNHINILSCAAIIALPGGAGTDSEIALALEYRRAIIGYGRESGALGADIPHAESIEEVEEFLREKV